MGDACAHQASRETTVYRRIGARRAHGLGVAALLATVTVGCGNGDSSSASSADAGARGAAAVGGTSAPGTGASENAGGGATTGSGGTTGTGSGGTSPSSGGVSASGGAAPFAGGAAAATGGAGGSAEGGAGGASATCSGASDACPMATGLSHACETRFALGVNYAWHNFGGDFGGIAAWGTKSVSQDPSAVDADLATMHANGASAVRWWVFPDFRGDGVTFDANGDPTGISATAVADVEKALELAAKNDVYVVLAISSFDDFRPDRTESGIFVRGMAPMVADATRRSKLTENVVRPLARAGAGSPNAAHLLGWDIINEPEWAVGAVGNAPGGQDFTPNSELTTVTLDQMKALINESSAVLKTETPNSLTSVGWAAAKWAWAFKDVSLDFDQPHIYGWVDQYWPYTKTPSELGYGSRPTVMGEFYLRAMPFSDGGDNAAFSTILGSWWDTGYAGAWAWQFADASQNLSLIQSFKTEKGCPAGF